MMKKKLIIYSICFALLYIYFRSGMVYVPVELLDIPSSTSVDLNQKGSADNKYTTAYATYNYLEKADVSRRIIPGTAGTIGGARENRQLHTPHRSIVALQKTMLMGEDFARYGISPFINIVFSNPQINDTALIAVTKGKAIDMLSFQVKGYPSAGDYIEGLMKFARNANFFSDTYKLIDIYVRMDAEGKNVVLPYIELKDDRPVITGMALFKKDKMVAKLDINDSRTLNMLREDSVKGMLTLEKNPKQYTDYSATTKRKVRVDKDGEKYVFTIDLSLKGPVISNSLYANLLSDPQVSKKFEDDMAKNVEKTCNVFIEKMQKELKVDCLRLGREAIAKYGRDTGTDWNEVVCNSKINVNVKVKFQGVGRGDY